MMEWNMHHLSLECKNINMNTSFQLPQMTKISPLNLQQWVQINLPATDFAMSDVSDTWSQKPVKQIKNIANLQQTGLKT